MGLDKNKVRLEVHNPKWTKMFEIEAGELRRIFGSLAIDINHVGSTSIPDICAKPIIDIQVSLRSLADFEQVRHQFEQAPYSVKPDPVPDEQLVRKGEETNRLFLIHVVEKGSERYTNTLLFRDYLLSHPETAKAYEALKIELATKYANDRPSYTAAKSDFIQGVIKQAKAN